MKDFPGPGEKGEIQNNNDESIEFSKILGKESSRLYSWCDPKEGMADMCIYASHRDAQTGPSG